MQQDIELAENLNNENKHENQKVNTCEKCKKHSPKLCLQYILLISLTITAIYSLWITISRSSSIGSEESLNILSNLMTNFLSLQNEVSSIQSVSFEPTHQVRGFRNFGSYQRGFFRNKFPGTDERSNNTINTSVL